MTIQEYVSDVLCVPVTRIGNRYIVEAIEIVLDTKDHKFYGKLANIIGETPYYLESCMRKAKNRAIAALPEEKLLEIFGTLTPTTTEFVVRATDYYRRTYENKT